MTKRQRRAANRKRLEGFKQENITAKEEKLHNQYAARREGLKKLAEYSKGTSPEDKEEAWKQLRNLARLEMAQEALRKGEDYEAQVMELTPFNENAQRRAPWEQPEKKPRKPFQVGKPGPLLDLEAAINDFYRWSKPTRNERAARKHLQHRVISMCRGISDGFIFEAFGSQLSFLARPLSDIDIRIYHPMHKDPRPTFLEKRSLQEELRAIRRVFNKLGRFTDVSLLHSRYPLVSMVDRNSGLQVQVVATSSTVGRSRDAVWKYRSEYNFMPELFAAVHAFFRSRGLCGVYMGGFSSYTIYMMIVAALKFSDPAKTAAEGLVSFFTFWSQDPTQEKSPFYRKGISIDPPVLFDKYAKPVGPEKLVADLKSGEKPYPPDYMLCLRDPADPTNDLGHKAAAIKHFRVTCAEVVRAMFKPPPPGQSSGMDKFLSRVVVGHIHEAEKRPRAKLEAYGQYLHKRSDTENRKLVNNWSETPPPLHRSESKVDVDTSTSEQDARM